MEPTDLTIQTLTSIRDEIRGLGTRIDETNTRLDRLEHRADETNARLDRLERRPTETEVRLATELVAVAHAVDGLRELLRRKLK